MSGPKHTPEACRTCGGWGHVDDAETLCPYCHGTGDYPVEKHIRLERAAPRLAEALKGAMSSFEAYIYLKEPPDDPDEYDVMMREKWEEARAALREAGIE